MFIFLFFPGIFSNSLKVSFDMIVSVRIEFLFFILIRGDFFFFKIGKECLLFVFE